VKKPIISVQRDKPHLIITGIRNITAAQTCSLTVTAHDTNPLQTHTFYFQQDLNMATIFTSPFWWTPPPGFSGTHQVFFKVTDTDDPAYWDTATVLINVSTILTAPNAPTNIKALVSGNVALTMTWDNAAADDYIIYRSNSKQGPFSARDTVTIPKFVDTINTLDYYYFLKSQNSAGVSATSDTIYSGKLRSAGPHWFLDTIALTGSEGATSSLALIDKCSGDSLSFFIASVPNVKNDTIIGATFSYIFGINDTNTYWPKIVAKDKTGAADTVTIRLWASKTDIDSIPPVMKYLTPSKDSISVNSSSYKISLICTDNSGIGSMKCSMGADTFISSKSSDSVWSATITGLALGQYSTIACTATDMSARKNKSVFYVHLKYDSTIADTVGPTFGKISGPSTGTTITNPVVNYLYSVIDPSGVDTVYWTLNNVRQNVLVVNTNNQITLTDSFPAAGIYHIVIYGQDKSARRNKSSENIDLTFDPTANDKSGPTINKVSGPLNGTKIADPNVSIVYAITDISGVDTVYWTLNNVRVGVLSPDANNQYTINAVLTASHINKIGIYAADKATAHNRSSDSTIVNYNRPPIISGIKDTTIQELSYIQLTVVATDPDNDIVTLSASGLPTGATFNTTTGAFLWSPSTSQEGPNTVLFKANDGLDTATKTITITITNVPAPVIASNPTDLAQCVGSPVSFSITATGTGTLSYQWQNSGVNLSGAHYNGATTNNLSINSVTANDAGAYTCVVSNSAGSKVSSTGAKLTVNSPTANPTSATANPTNICAGGSTLLSVNGGPLGTGASWKWYTNSTCTTPVSGSNTGASLTVSPTSVTTYYVRAEGTCNTSTAVNVTVTINTSSVAATSVSASPTSICPGGSTLLSVTGGTLGTGAAWKWYTNSACTTPVSGGNSGASLTVSPSVNTTYYVRAEGTCNMTAAVNAIVTINSLSASPTGTTANPTTISSGATSSLNVSGGSLGTSALWKWYTNSGCTSPVTGNNIGATISVSPTTTTTYYVRAEGSCNNTSSQSITVNVSAGSGLVAYYPFNGNANDASGNGFNATINGAQLTSDRSNNANSAYYFNGNAGISAIADSRFSLSQFTLCGWIKGSTYTNTLPRIVAVGKAGIATHYYSLLYANGNWGGALDTTKRLIFFNASTLDPMNYELQFSHGSLDTLSWHHAAVSFNGSHLKFYIDGVLDKDTIITTAIQQFSDSAKVQIGYSEGGDQYNGKLDQIRIYNRPLTDSEVNALFTGGN
jgi:hypothetical protein